MEEIKTPKIRFKGFTDDWEQRKLVDLIDVRSGRDYKHLSVGNIPVFGTGGYMLSVDRALSYSEDAIGIGRKGTINKPYLLKAPFWTVDTLFYAIPRDENNLSFIYSVFQMIDWMKKDESTGVPSLSKYAINNTEVFAPKYTEQKKIGDFFSVLDKTIALHQRKLDAFTTLKQAYLQQIFSQKIHFFGFIDEWEKRKINTLFEVTRGSVLSAEKICSEKNIEYQYPVYSSQTKNGGLMGYYNIYLYEDAITWTTDGANAGTVNYRSGKFYSTNVNGVLLSDKGYANKAVAEALNKIAWKYVSKVGNPKLMNNTMENIIISIPKNMIEMRKISALFCYLDEIINVSQVKINILKKIKKFYLHELF